MTEQAKETKATETKSRRAASTDDLPKATANARTIPFPQDPQGALAQLKSGGINAAGRIKGSAEKLAAFERTLQLLRQHARARYEVDTGERAKARENAVAARQRHNDRAVRIALRDAEAAQARADSLLRDAEALRGNVTPVTGAE